MKISRPLDNQKEINSYLKDINKLPTLNLKKEKLLINQLSDPDLTDEQIKDIEAKLVEGNLKFVITVAKEYQNQGLNLADLISEGNFGLVKALKTFDSSRNIRFMSYAVWWIRQSILQSLNEHSRTIRIPVNIIQEINKMKKKDKNHKTEEDILICMENDDRMSLVPSSDSIMHIDSQINENEDTLLDIISDPNSEYPDTELIDNKNNIKDELDNILTKSLDDREKTVIMDYFGLRGEVLTLEEIGEEIDLTKERVRQIKEKAIKKLRNSSEFLQELIK